MSQTFDRSASMREYHGSLTPEERTKRTENARLARKQRIAKLLAENEELRAENESLRALVAA